MKNLTFHSFQGRDARKVAQQIAQLRLKVFWEFPYLYEGNLDYELRYLETYFKAKDSFVYLVRDEETGDFVGATTGIRASEEEESFRTPFKEFGLDTDRIFYFGESILLPKYRGKGIGKIFFEEREKFARSLGSIQTLAFCAVMRPIEHPLKPAGYKPLDEFWKSQGFSMQEGLVTEYSWKDRDNEKETKKLMQFWLKNI